MLHQNLQSPDIYNSEKKKFYTSKIFYVLFFGTSSKESVSLVLNFLLLAVLCLDIFIDF